MKHLLNTLYVTTQGSYLHQDGETVAVMFENETRLRVPIHTLEGVICLGRVTVSPPLMKLCCERGVYISYLSEQGNFYARVEGPISGNVLLRREQYRIADDEVRKTELARAFVVAKVANSRMVLLRALRDHSDKIEKETTGRACRDLAAIIEELKADLSLDQIRGKEGEAARCYFDVFDNLIVAQKEDFYFRGRNRRPPMDNMNALLSFVYTLVTHDVRSALQSVGLDPAVGYLHADRPGRPSLALDLIEELRPPYADRLALSLVNRQQVRGKGFTTTETGAVMMDDATRKEVIVAYQERKKEEILHPFLNDKVMLGLLPHIQALLLARYLRGDLDGYPPFAK